MSEDVSTRALFEPNGLSFRKVQALFLPEHSRVTDRATSRVFDPPRRLAYSSRTASMTAIAHSYCTHSEDPGTIIAVGMLWGTLTLRCRNHAGMATRAPRDIFRDSRGGLDGRDRSYPIYS